LSTSKCGDCFLHDTTRIPSSKEIAATTFDETSSGFEAAATILSTVYSRPEEEKTVGGMFLYMDSSHTLFLCVCQGALDENTREGSANESSTQHIDAAMDEAIILKI
jgi:hypothetical protein